MANACPSDIMNSRAVMDNNAILSPNNVQPCFILLDRDEVSTYFEEHEKSRSQESLFSLKECSNGSQGPNTRLTKDYKSREGKSTDNPTSDEELPRQQKEIQDTEIYPSLPECPLSVCNPGTSFDEDLTDDMYPEIVDISEAENILETDIALNASENHNETNHLMCATKSSNIDKSVSAIYNNTETYIHSTSDNNNFSVQNNSVVISSQNNISNITTSSEHQTYQIYPNKRINTGKYQTMQSHTQTLIHNNLELNGDDVNNIHSESNQNQHELHGINIYKPDVTNVNGLQLNSNTMKLSETCSNNKLINHNGLNLQQVTENDHVNDSEINDLQLNQTDLNDLELSSDSITLQITESIANDLQTKQSFTNQLEINESNIDDTSQTVLQSNQNNIQLNTLQLNASKINQFELNQLQLEINSSDLNDQEKNSQQLNTNTQNLDYIQLNKSDINIESNSLQIETHNLQIDQVHDLKLNQSNINCQLKQLITGKMKFNHTEMNELDINDMQMQQTSTSTLQFDQSNQQLNQTGELEQSTEFDYNQSEMNNMQINHIIITDDLQSQVNQTITGDLEFNGSEMNNLEYNQNLGIEIKHSDINLQLNENIINESQVNHRITGDIEYNGSEINVIELTQIDSNNLHDIKLNQSDIIRLELTPPDSNSLSLNHLEEEINQTFIHQLNQDCDSNVQIIQIDTDNMQITQLNNIQLSNELEFNQLGLQLTPPDSNEIQLTSDSNDIDQNNILVVQNKDPLELDLELGENYIKEHQEEILILTTQIAVPTCNTCNNIFESIKDLEFHKRLHILKPNMFRDHFCTVCKNTFNNHCSFTLHFLKIHKQIKLNDPDCIYNGKKACKCQVCFSIFEDSLIFYAHCSPYDYISNLVNSCTVCDEKFGDSASALMDHSAQVHKVELCFVCRICSNKMQLKSSLRRHVQFNHNVRKIHCKRCRNAFIDTAYIKTHLEKSKNMCTYLCPFCDEPISISKDLQVKHIKEHLEKLEANLQCGICLNYFYSYNNFLHHANMYHDGVINILPPSIISKNVAFKKDCITNTAVPVIDENFCVDIEQISMNDCLGNLNITKVSKKNENKHTKKVIVTEPKRIELKSVQNDNNDSSSTNDSEKEIQIINKPELVTLPDNNDTANNIIQQKKVLEYFCEHCLTSYRTYKLLSIHMTQCKSSKDKKLPKNLETCVKGNRVHGYISRQLKNGMEKGYCLNIKEKVLDTSKLDTLSNIKVKKNCVESSKGEVEIMYLESKSDNNEDLDINDINFSPTIDTSDILDYVNLSENEPSTSTSNKHEALSNEDIPNSDLTMEDLDFEDFKIDITDETSIDLVEEINLNSPSTIKDLEISLKEHTSTETSLKRKASDNSEHSKKSIIQRPRTDKMLPLTLYDGNVNIPCLHCHTICTDTYKLEKHLRNIHYSCKLCEIIFENKNELIKHENEHKLGNIYFYMCLCTKAFKNLNSLNKHIKTNKLNTSSQLNNPQVKEHCMILKRKIVDLYVKNVNILPSKAVCSYCNNIFDSSCLDHHNKIVHNVCICTKCNYKFVNFISVLNNSDGSMLSICKTCLKSPSATK